jgi:hypothetical protein
MARVADAIIGSRKPRDPGDFNLLFAWQRTGAFACASYPTYCPLAGRPRAKPLPP